MLLRGAPGVFLITLILCLFTTGGHLYSPDEEIMFRVTESLATRGKLDVEPIIGPDGKTFATRRGINGREYAQYGVGNSLAGVPFYWLGAAVSTFVSDSTARDLLDFHTQLYAPEDIGRGHGLLKRFFVSFTGSFILAATTSLIFLLCRNLRRGKQPGDGSPEYSIMACRITALAYAGATMALPHARTFFSEPLAGLFLLWSFYLLATPSVRTLTVFRAAAAGGALALAFFTRLDTVFAAPGVGIYLLCRLNGGSAEPPLASISDFSAAIRRRLNASNILTVIAFFLPIFLFGAWQLLMNKLHFGSPFSSAYADQPEGINFSTPILAGLYGFLFSIGKSLLLFSPAIMLGLLGWGRFSAAHRALTVGLAISIIGKLAIHSTWQNWAGGWCWGPRHVFIIHALLMVPAVAFISQPGKLRRLSIDGILLAGLMVQIYGSSQNFIDYYILYFRTPYTPPQATVMYGPEDLAPSYIKAEATGPDGETVPFPVQSMPAPISDSIYVPQNSQWYRYSDMWNSGYTDNLWLRLIQRERGKEQPVN